MKKLLIIIALLLVITSLASCAKPEIIPTVLGDFESSEKVMASIEGIGGSSLIADTGNILLVLYLTPVKDNNVTMDQAGVYFSNGSTITVEDTTYDMSCIAYEQSAGAIKYGLVFEIKDNGYTDNKIPSIEFSPPAALPTPEPAATPVTTQTPVPSPVATTAVTPTGAAT